MKGRGIPFSALPKDAARSKVVGFIFTLFLFKMLNVKQESCEYQLLNFLSDLTRESNPGLLITLDQAPV